MLSALQIESFRRAGHVTVPNVLTAEQVAATLADIEVWAQQFISGLSSENKRWYLESGGAAPQLRKLDNPANDRPLFRDLAREPRLVAMVEQLIGGGVSVFFSQVFLKPPEVGGPKPVHQDNFYFGPDDLNATLTVWIALDEATVENGCLFYADGSHHGPVYDHVAPEGQPFNLQIAPEHHGDYKLTAAPVSAGGISFHHGNTWHQSSANTSDRPRRAVAFHYFQNAASLVRPALTYDSSVTVRASE